MTNEMIQIAVEMESLKTDLYQNTIILENKAVRELGLGVVTPALVTLITNVYSNKAALIALDMLKNNQQPDVNTLYNYIVSSNQSPVMLNILNQNQLLFTVANNGLVLANNIKQKATEAAKLAIRNQIMRGNNNMYQQPMNQFGSMGNMGMAPMVAQPMVAQPMNQYVPNVYQPAQNTDGMMSSGVYNEKYANKQTTVATPVVTASNNRYGNSTPVEQPKLVPVEAIPSENKVSWLCAPGVSVNANGDAIGSIKSDLVLGVSEGSLEGELNTQDALQACLFKVNPNTLSKFKYKIKKRQFTTTDKYNSLVSRCLSYYTSKVIVAVSAVSSTVIDDILTDKDDLITALTQSVAVIKDRIETENIINEIYNNALASKSRVHGDNSPIDNKIIEVSYSEVRDTYLVHSDALLSALNDVAVGFDKVVSISKYSYPGVFNSLSKIIQEEGGFLDLFVGSIQGYYYLTMYQKDPNTDIKFVVVENKIK